MPQRHQKRPKRRVDLPTQSREICWSTTSQTQMGCQNLQEWEVLSSWLFRQPGSGPRCLLRQRKRIIREIFQGRLRSARRGKCLGGISLNKEVLTQARLRRLLSYDAATGLFVWRSRPDKRQFNAHFAGSVAGTLQSARYVQICIDGKKYLAHRLAFLFIRGPFPRGHVDHANHVPSDNRFENLRAGTQSQNRGNSRRPSSNSSGRKGAYLYRRKWHAKITKDYEQHYLGSFDSIEEAAAVYAAAAKRLFGDFARID